MCDAVHSHIDQFPETAWIFWVKTDVWEWAVCVIVAQVSQRVWLNMLCLTDLKQARPPAFE